MLGIICPPDWGTGYFPFLRPWGKAHEVLKETSVFQKLPRIVIYIFQPIFSEIGRKFTSSSSQSNQHSNAQSWWCQTGRGTARHRSRPFIFLPSYSRTTKFLLSNKSFIQWQQCIAMLSAALHCKWLCSYCCTIVRRYKGRNLNVLGFSFSIYLVFRRIWIDDVTTTAQSTYHAEKTEKF